MSRCSYCGAPVSAEARAQEYLSWLLHALVFFEDLQIFSVELLKDMDSMSPLQTQQCLMILMDAIVFYGYRLLLLQQMFSMATFLPPLLG